MKQYHDLLGDILDNGHRKSDRTGTGTLSLFGYQMRFDLSKGFPLVTTKKLHVRSIIHELLWFIRGDTDIKYLRENGVTIWDEWATEDQCARFRRPAGELGPVYGHQWRNFGGRLGIPKTGIDQLSRVVDQIKATPDSRRLIVSAWNPAEADVVALPPCHTLFQFYVADGRLSCQLYQRSADCFLGVPYNIASYSFLTHMIADVCGLAVGDFVHTIGDAHLYANHVELARMQLGREARQLPMLELSPAPTIFDFTYDHFKIVGYDPWPAIKADVAV